MCYGPPATVGFLSEEGTYAERFSCPDIAIEIHGITSRHNGRDNV